MDYEKKYKEALERAKKFIEENPLVQNLNTWIKETFPELKEPEDEKVRKALIEMVHDTTGDELWVDYNVHKEEALAWLEKQGEQKPADTVEQKCEESKTKVFDAPTPFEDKLYAFVLACEILVDPSKREFILEHSQEILDAAKEQIGKEQSSAWSKEDEKILNGLISSLVRIEANTRTDSTSINYTFPREINWLKALKQRIGG